MDVSSITAATIEEFLKYLDLNTDENERDLNRRLTQVNASGRRETHKKNENFFISCFFDFFNPLSCIFK